LGDVKTPSTIDRDEPKKALTAAEAQIEHSQVCGPPIQDQ
jgi:hypothetical protein